MWMNENIGGTNSFTNRGLATQAHYLSEAPTLSTSSYDSEGELIIETLGTLSNWGSGFNTYATSNYEVLDNTISSYFNGLKHVYYFKLRSA